MAFDFPASPTEGQVYAPLGGPTYTFKSPVWLASTTVAEAGPVGSIVYMPSANAPDNYLKANGALLSRTAYAALYAFAVASGNIVTEASWSSGNQGAFSTGDLSTTFRIPDMRGVFARGLDDGRGLDTGRTLGGYQADAYLNHAHTASQGTHYHDVTGSAAYSSGSPIISNTGIGSAQATFTSAKISSAESAGPITVNASATGGTETRGKNYPLLACIRYQ